MPFIPPSGSRDLMLRGTSPRSRCRRYVPQGWPPLVPNRQLSKVAYCDGLG